jgi:flavin-dependent dehydrogenase
MKRVSDELGQKPKVLKTWDCGDPIFTIPGKFTGKGLALTGGCAGQSGIAFGIVAGGICGRVAAEAAVSGDVKNRSLGEYPRAWKKTLGANYRQGRFALELVRRLRDDELDRVAHLFTERGLNHLMDKSLPGLTLSIINTCLHEDPAALFMLKAFFRG